MQKGEKFPDGFLWGSATAAYQVEGGIDNCDWALAAEKGKVPRAGRACDHYNRYEEDFDIAKSLSQNAHRFSIEWARIEPEEGVFDEEEIEHYRKVLNALHKRGIKPFVTLWHFTLPDWFAKKGGFQNRKAPALFARYCAYVVEQLGSKADFWMTMNESMVWTSGGYLRGSWPPFRQNAFQYLKAIRRLIASHNLAYAEIKKINPALQVGVAENDIHFVSSGGWWNDVRAKFMRNFWNHKFQRGIKDCQDFIGLNYYHPIFFGVHPKLPKTDMGWPVMPEGFYELLMGLKSYGKPIYVTENGIADAEDRLRAEFIREHVGAMAKAISAGVDIRGYFYWSLLDNFEWSFGFGKRFGLVEVDYDTMGRTVRKSAYVYKDIAENNSLV